MRAKVEHDAGILAAGKGDVVAFGIPAKRFRLVKPQPIHRDLDLVHLNELHFFQHATFLLVDRR